MTAALVVIAWVVLSGILALLLGAVLRELTTQPARGADTWFADLQGLDDVEVP